MIFYSPCEMCTGTSILYKVPRIIVGENLNYKVSHFPFKRIVLNNQSPLKYRQIELSLQFLSSQIQSPGEEWFRESKVEVHLEQSQECIELMRDFIKNNPVLWNEDIHVPE